MGWRTVLVILKACTQCGEKQKEPLTWAVGAWKRADGVRVAYRQNLCMACTVAKLAPLQTHSDGDLMTCPQCGIGTEDNYDAVYISWIPKHVGKLTIESPFCPPCAAHFRIWWMHGAELLPERVTDREGASDAPSPSSNQLLAALGWPPEVVEGRNR